MKINNISIKSHTALDFEINVSKPVTVLRGKHSALALDLMREVLGDHNSVCDPDNIDDGHFIIHADVDKVSKYKKRRGCAQCTSAHEKIATDYLF